MFTEEDLSQIKKHIEDGQERGFVSFHTDDLADLVNRLECAEAALTAECECSEVSNSKECKETVARNVWLKSAGWTEE